MRHCFSLFALIYLSFPALCQTVARPSTTVPGKAIIDSAAIAHWYDLVGSEPTISPNGKYFMYPIENFPIGRRTLVIQSTHGVWKREFIEANPGVFSFDSKFAIFQSSDTLFFLALGKDSTEYVTGVNSFIYPQIGSNDGSPNYGKFIAYKLSKNDALILKDLVNGKASTIDHVSDFLFNNSGKAILIKRVNSSSACEELEWVDVASKKSKRIWSNKGSGSSIRSNSFDEIGEQVVFLTQDKSAKNNTVWYYKPGMQEAEIKISNEMLKKDTGMLISVNAPSFNKTGRYIFFTLQNPDESSLQTDPNAVQVDVWNHKDLVLQPLQQYFNTRKEEMPQWFIKTQFTSIVNIENGQVRQLENDSTVIVSQNYHGDFVITSAYQSTGDKRSDYRKKPYYITSLKDGTRKYLTNGVAITFSLSPNKRFLVYFDTELKKYISYDIENGSTKNITESIPVKLTDNVIEELIDPNPAPAGIACWLTNGKLLIRDNYDIWMIDPSGAKVSENITSGYGRANNIKFDLIIHENGGVADENATISSNKSLLLSGFWVHTKRNGFFKVNLNKKTSPQVISAYDCLIYASDKQTSGSGFLGSKIRKADHADVWIVKKQTITAAPSFFLTSDLKYFKQLTNVQPHKKYRWATNELITWPMPDGTVCQGILYKPENFDSTKKYPVIFYYYEQFSGSLHQFLAPNLSSGAMNIPWFVNRDYLVFVPDIHYTVGSVAKSVVNSVLPGAHTLLKLPFIDSRAIGLQGHSFGGYETNVLITESNLFAAAAEGAGASNLISRYGSLLPTARSNGQGSYMLEYGGQQRVKGLLWENVDAYIENSPIFKANKVTTPLLIMHNKGDQAVPWGQAVELFIALRRLEKPVWMLQYDQGGHGVNSTKDKMDFSIRMTQYFDHYLKGVPAPKWMTQGIPASMKGIETGYALDPAGKCDKDCKICKKCNNEWNKDSVKVKEEMKLWDLRF